MATLVATPFLFVVVIANPAEDSKWLSLRYEASCIRISQAFRLLRDGGIEPILIKGYAAAREYPEPSSRQFADIDICVRPDQLDMASAVLTERDLGLGVDLHAGLRHLDSQPWDETVARSELIEVNGEAIRVLCREDHLRVLVTHWLNDGGARRDRLADFWHTINNKDGRFDWGRCLGGIPHHRRAWIAKALGACIRFEGAQFASLPFSEDELRLPHWFAAALEKEWASEPLYPLYYLLGEPRRFFAQLARRFPPNPIQATIEMDAQIDDSPRLAVQLSSFVRRVPTGIRMQLQALRARNRR